MSASLRRRLAAGLLVAVTLWPLAQITLVYTHDLSPWKLSGWGMYSAPPRTPYLVIGGARAGQEPFAVWPVAPALDDDIRTYLTARVDFPPAADPDALAARVFEVYPDLEHVWLDFSLLRVDRASARMVRVSEVLPYTRPRE